MKTANKVQTILCTATLFLGTGLQAQPAGGLQFDGVNDYVTFYQASGLNAAAFTIETWFKRTGPGSTAGTGTGGLNAVPLVAKGRGEADGSNVDMNWFLGLSGNVIAADFEDTATGGNHPVSGTTAVADNTWYHAAATYDGSVWRLYLNGQLEGEPQDEESATPRADSIQHASLGTALTSSGAAQGFFCGVLKEARVWNHARTQQEIADNMSAAIPAGTPGLLGRWALDETSGTVAHDGSGNGIDGDLVGGPIWGEANVLITKGPYLQNVTPNSIVVLWETHVPAPSRVDYGMTDISEAHVEDATLKTIHEVTLPDLVGGSGYFYKVTSDDAESNVHIFVTPPPASAAFRFVVYGDTRTQVNEHRAVVQAILAANPPPEFVLHVGDLVEFGRSYSQWSPQYFDPAADLLWNTPLFPVLGNHEYSRTDDGSEDRMYYFDFFALPNNESWYAFTYGCVRVVAINSCSTSPGGPSFAPGSAQYNWLVTEMQSPEYESASWQIAVFHHPPYTSRTGTEIEQVKEYLVPLFIQYGIDVVFNGHDHNYRRVVLDGIQYVITGGGGAPLRDLGAAVEGQVAAEMTYQHCIVDVLPDRFDCVSLRNDLSVIDSFSIDLDVTPPAISGVQAVDVSDHSARIVWTTDEPADSRVDYGLDAGYGSQALDSQDVQAHSIILTGLGAGTPHHYRVTSVDPSGNSASSGDYEFTTAPEVNDPPSVPTGVTAEPAYESVILDWLASTDPEGDPVSYNLYRSETEGVRGALIATVTAHPHVDGELANGTTYYYIVTATDGLLESDDSIQVSATPNAVIYTVHADQNPVVTVGNLVGDYTATFDADGQTQNITEAGSAAGASLAADYALVSGVDPAGVSTLTLTLNATWSNQDADEILQLSVWNLGNNDWEVLSGVVAGVYQFTLSPPQDYLGAQGTLQVRVADSAFLMKEKKDTLSIDQLQAQLQLGPPDTTPPAAPSGLAATAGDTQVLLDWDDNSELDLAGYDVYRSLSEVGGYALITASPVRSSDYIDGGLVNGTIYYYHVVALDFSGNQSAPSGTAQAAPFDQPPAAPTGLVATPGDTQVTLNWDDNSEPDLQGYNVYRSDTSGGYGTTPLNSLIVVGSSYVDAGVANGATFYYVVRAVDISAHESPDSNEASATPSAQQAMHVESITVDLIPAGRNMKGSAAVTVVDQGDLPLAGAVVSGTWYLNDPSNSLGTGSGTTDGSGTTTILSVPVKPAQGDVYIFEVGGVTLDGYVYNPSQGVISGSSEPVP